MAGKTGAVKPGELRPVLDDQRDRIAVDRLRTEPITLRCRFGSGAFRDARWRQPPQAAEQRAVADCRSGEPRVERLDRAERGAALGQPEFGAACVLVIFAPRQKELDAVYISTARSMTCVVAAK